MIYNSLAVLVKRPFLIVFLLVVLIAGWRLSVVAGDDAVSGMKARILERTRIGAANVTPAVIKSLAGAPIDCTSEVYVELKRRLTAMCNSQNDIRYIYLMGYRDAKIFFFMDSEPDRITDPSRPALAVPGEIYDDAPKELYAAFKNPGPMTFGPYSDKWGTFVSCWIPIFDGPGGKLLTIAGADIYASDWNRIAIRARMTFFMMVMLSGLLCATFYVHRLRSAEIAAQASERLKYQNALLDFVKCDNSDLTDSTRRLVGIISEMLDVARVSVWHYSEDLSGIICDVMYQKNIGYCGHGDSLTFDRYPAYFSALARERKVVADDAERDPRTREFKDGYLVPNGITSMLDAMIWLHGRPVGVVCLEHVGPVRNWREAEVDFIVSLADMVSLIFESSEKRKAEERLADSSYFLEKIINTVADPMFVKDSGYRFILVNDAFCDLMGLKREELVGRSDRDLLPAEQAEAFMAHDRRVLETGVESVVEETLTSPRMAGRTFVTRKTIYSDKSGNGYLVGVARDITEIRRMESENLKTSKLESLGILAGGIAHDFNNILMGIIGNISIAKKRIDPADRAHEALARAEGVAYKARTLTEQLITFSRGGTPIKKSCDVNEIVRGAAQFALTGSGAALDLRLAPKIMAVEADVGQIAQVVTNIVINAKLAVSQEGGRITVSTSDAPERGDLPVPGARYVEITVSDNGCGIPRENIGKIFDPYFTTRPGGSGLGLSTSYSIVRNHGGAIGVSSLEGAGTTFYVLLPASGGSVKTENGPEAVSAKASVAGGRILIMDDEDDVLVPLCETLTDMGYSVTTAHDGQETLDAYKKGREDGVPYDLVIMDIVIRGGLGGAETIVKLLEMDPAARAIVSSGYSNDPIMSDYGRYGFKGVLAKPYRIDEIGSVISGVIAAGPRASGLA